MIRYARPALKATIAGLAALLVLELAFHLAAAPNLRLAKVVYTADQPRGDTDALTLLGLRPGEYYFSISEDAVKRRLVSLPWVKTAEVRKRFPDTLAVELKVRQPLAVSVVGGAILAIDEDGQVTDVRTDAQGLDLPVISGVSFESLRAGSRFPDAARGVFTKLSAVKTGAPALYRQISELQLRDNGHGGFDTVLFPARTSVRVVLGDRWDRGTLEQGFVLLDLVRRQGWESKTREIDFRATPVVIRPRES